MHFSPKTVLRNLFFAGFFLFHFSYFLPASPLPLPTKNQPIILYSTDRGQSLQDLALQVIESSKRSLHVATFSLADRKIIKALKEASDRGVEVFVAVDKKGLSCDRESLGGAALSQRAIKGLMHQKWIISDGILSIVGSANLTSTSLRSHHNHYIAIHSKTYAKQLLEEAKKKVPSHIHPIGSSWKTSIPPYTLYSWTSPKNSDQKDALLDALDSVRDTLEIAMYTFTEKGLLEKVVDAHKRGVKVTVLLDHGQALGASHQVLQRLMKEGIKVGLSKDKPLLHHKFAWLDRKQFFTGSFNWTKAALTQNEELLTLFIGGEASDPFWVAVKETWDSLTIHVEWQKNEDWFDWIWKNGWGSSQDSAKEGACPDSHPFKIAA